MPIAIPVLGKVSYEPITAYRMLGSGMGMAEIERMSEAASQTFNQGVPLTFSSGLLQECTFSGADVIVGFSAEPGHNLTTGGVKQDGFSEATPRNQASGKTIPIGAWVRDGKIGLYAANDTTIFSAALKSGQVYTDALLIAGTFYRLIKDATTGFWYVDNTLTGGNAGVVQLIGVDPSCPNTATDGSRVFFQVKPAQRYFN